MQLYDVGHKVLNLSPVIYKKKFSNYYIHSLNKNDAGRLIRAANGIFIINGLGGAAMTLSFGFAEEVIKKHIT